MHIRDCRLRYCKTDTASLHAKGSRGWWRTELGMVAVCLNEMTRGPPFIRESRKCNFSLRDLYRDWKPQSSRGAHLPNVLDPRRLFHRRGGDPARSCTKSIRGSSMNVHIHRTKRRRGKREDWKKKKHWWSFSLSSLFSLCFINSRYKTTAFFDCYIFRRSILFDAART